MTTLPDRKRPRLSPPARALAASLARFGAAALWRALHPATRERFVEAPAPAPLDRLYYEAVDGWRAPLFHMPAAPGGAGEPVLLAHALGLGADAFRYGRGPTLAGALSAAGFSVYLLTHRGDRAALAPPGRSGFDFDHIVERDVPAALERVCDHAGAPRVHWVGHGLGGQLGLAWAGRSGCDRLASVATLCAAVRFAPGRSEARSAAMLLSLLPRHWRLPSRAVARALSPWVDGALAPGVGPASGACPPERMRGLMQCAVEDLPIGLVVQMQRWLEAGSLVDAAGWFDYAEALVDADVPLLVALSAGDRVCTPGMGVAAHDLWGAGDRTLLSLPAGYAHPDPLLAPDAEREVFAPVTDWLRARRELAWDLSPSGRSRAAALGR